MKTLTPKEQVRFLTTYLRSFLLVRFSLAWSEVIIFGFVIICSILIFPPTTHKVCALQRPLKIEKLSQSYN